MVDMTWQEALNELDKGMKQYRAFAKIHEVIDTATRLKNEMNRYKQAAEDAKASVDAIVKQIADLEQSYNEKYTSCKNDIEAMTKTIGQLRTEKQQLHQGYVEAKKQHEILIQDLERMKDRRNQLSKDVNALESESASLTTRVSELKKQLDSIRAAVAR